MAQHEIDPTFLALPYQRLAQVALERARDFGVSHADFRFERNRYQHFSVRDGALEGAQDAEDLGFAVRVILDGVMDTLDSLRDGGRVVGLVSHVAELRNRVPSQLEVRKSRHGSTLHSSVVAG